ncbi:GAF domain-containing protein [Streptomyces sp. NPDC016845]|uniref:GAF domain-containing protein n=1 Tax=Streptomyces sp. NPDC016845 TaxID=3364972 RepID=UPI0037957A52
MDMRADTAAWRRVVEVASAGGCRVALPSAAAACAEDAGADGLGVSLITSGQIRMVAHGADERSYRLEDAQLVAGEGPCTEAYLRRRIVEADLQLLCERWPVFWRVADDLGIRTVVAVPLLVGDGVPVGAMDLYHTAPAALGAAERARLQAYGRILALLALDSHPALIGWEQAAPEPGPAGYPPLVHQAAGMAAAAGGVPVAEALARMRAHAFSHQRLLEDIAHDVLKGRLRLKEDRDTPPG